MQRIERSKILAFITSLCLLVLLICQNVVFVFAEVQQMTSAVDFAESIYQSNTHTTEIKGIFGISGLSVNTGYVSAEIIGSEVIFTVWDGEPSRIGPHTKKVTVKEESSYNRFPGEILYNQEGYIGNLDKVDSGFDSAKGTYWATYYGSVTKEECEYYHYIVEYSYTLNVAPQLSFTSSDAIPYVKDKFDIKGFVKDENIGDELNIYYTFDSYNDSIKGKIYKSEVITDGMEQSIDGQINIESLGLNDGIHTLYMWAVDKRGERSVPAEKKINVDTEPPQTPILVQDPVTVTNGNVEVTVTYPDDAVIKEVRIDDSEWKNFDDVSVDGKIIMDQNGTVEARCSDEAGNVSDIGSLVVGNIDKISPDAPVLVPDITEPTNKTVTVEVYYSDDSVIKEIRIEDGDWELYDGPITVDKNTIIEARSMDEAGNTSPIGQLIIGNIDTTLPTAPIITVSAEKTTEKPITATITPGKDEESGVDRTEYCLEGATVSDWQEYIEGRIIVIKNTGNTIIKARTIDKAGNTSPVASKSVTIDSDSNSGGNNGGGNSGGGNNGGGNSGGNNGGGNNGGGNSGGGNNGGGNNGGGNNGGGNSGGNNGGNNSGGSNISEPKDNIPSVTAVDLAVFITSDKSKYAEGETITFAIDYKNKSNVLAADITIKAEIPAYTTVVEASGGTVKEQAIEWKIDKLNANTSGRIEYKVSVNKLDKAEVNSSNTVTINSPKLTNTEDDSSKTIFLLYSNTDNFHTKYIAGYADNTFRPANNITRAEVAAIIYNVLEIDKVETPGKTYTDVKSTHWAYKCINAVTNAGLFVGYSDGSFHPDSYITRAEFATVLANYLGLKNVEHDKMNFSDISTHWARNFIEEIYRVKLIEGYIENGDRIFKPNNNISRSEAVTIVNKMLFRGPLAGVEMPFKDVDKNHWAFGHILESSLDHHFRRAEDNSEMAIMKE